MDQLPVDMLRPALYVFSTLLTLALGLIGYFLQDLRTSIKEKLQKQEKEISELRKKQEDDIEKVVNQVIELKSTLPHKYVLRDDFIRAVASLDNKVETMCKEFNEMNKNLSKLIGGMKHGS